MKKTAFDKPTNRRTFLKQGSIAAGAATLTAGLLGPATSALAAEQDRDRSGRLTKGDAAILRFLQTIEGIEQDLWQQYAELGGVTQGTQNQYQLARPTS